METFGLTICIFSISFNALILVAFAVKKSLQKKQNLLLVNLAFGDIVYCLVGFPMHTISDLDNSLYCYDAVQQARHFVAAFTISVSINNIATLALERFIAIQFPYFYCVHFTMNTTIVMALMSWMMAAVEATMFTVIYFIYDRRVAFNIIISTTVLVFLLAVSLYIWIYIVSKRHFKRDLALGIINKDSKSKSAIMVAGMCAISWLPVFIVRIVNQMVDVGPWRQLTVLSPLLGTSFNLFIYILRMSDFRHAVKELLFGKRQEPNRGKHVATVHATGTEDSTV